MTPVDQTVVGLPHGNCTAACIASIIGEPVEAIPNFNQWSKVFGHWEIAAQAWLRHRGWELSQGWALEWAAQSEVIWCSIFSPGEAVLAGGKNPDGDGHMVVWSGDWTGGLLHDPNPRKRGLDGPPEFLMTLRRIEHPGPSIADAAEALYALAE